MNNIIQHLLSLSRSQKKIIFIIHDMIIIFMSFWLSFALRIQAIDYIIQPVYWIIVIALMFFTIALFIKIGLYKEVIRYFGSHIFTTAFTGSLFSTFFLVISCFIAQIFIPRSIPFIYFLQLLLFLISSRLIIQRLLQTSSKKNLIPVIIYGAEEPGRQLCKALQQSSEYYPIAFIDDKKELQHTIINNLEVFSSDKIYDLIDKYEVKKILLAIERNEQRRKIITQLQQYHCEVLSIPGMNEFIEGTVSISNLKKVSIIDLLGRTPVKPIDSLLKANLYNKVIMVTGAGGSIGSELCRQILKNNPKLLILLEISEYSLYSIDKELNKWLQEKSLSIPILPFLGSVQNQEHVLSIMQTYGVQTLYHAAAYKHVPMVELNNIEGVRNNIFGTLHCAQAAIQAHVETFVLISTDKAVRPTNTMGATKRIAELILQALSEQNTHQTRFCMVRFGNVLGSSGSVIPLFEKQIELGGPVTLTHPDITRFFMTIPEAAQLVLQAGAMGKGGDVFVLDMGQSIKIMDLAQKMIALSGLHVKNDENPDGDIEIKITGLRPGEKLYEELLIGGEITATEHNRIFTAREVHLPYPELSALIEQLNQACIEGDQNTIRDLLLQSPIGFTPQNEICDLIWKKTHS